MSLQEKIQLINSSFEEEVQEVIKKKDFKQIESLRIRFLGRQGMVAELFSFLKKSSQEEKPKIGKIINELRDALQFGIKKIEGLAQEWAIENDLEQDGIDISLPVGDEHPHSSSLHPVTLTYRIILKQLRQMGFSIVDGPELDYDYYNFLALNFCKDHPARDMHDTFYIAGQKNLMLRTHTSNLQIHTMLDRSPPLRVVGLGRVFRCDYDLTHTPMFHQIEAFMIDKDINFSHLKATIITFMKALYGRHVKIRFRPSYFPFVEPGAEVDIICLLCKGKGCRVCKQTGWVEIAGCGMIHPNVFENVAYDSEDYTGFAFGFGVDRIAMLRYGLSDLRQLFSGYQKFLSQFPIWAY